MNERDLGVLRVFAAVEILGLLVATGLVTGSLLGATDLLTEFSRGLRLAALAFLIVEILVPVAALWDMRRHGRIDEVWLHVTLTPVVNLLGLFAYLEHRRRTEPGDVPEVE